jgi:hypothetical protein
MMATNLVRAQRLPFRADSLDDQPPGYPRGQAGAVGDTKGQVVFAWGITSDVTGQKQWHCPLTALRSPSGAQKHHLQYHCV